MGVNVPEIVSSLTLIIGSANVDARRPYAIEMTTDTTKLQATPTRAPTSYKNRIDSQADVVCVTTRHV